MSNPTTTDQGDERRALVLAGWRAAIETFTHHGAAGWSSHQEVAIGSALSVAQPVAQEASDPINDPEIVAIRSVLDWVSTGKSSTGKELADRAYLALGRVRSMLAAPQPSQGIDYCDPERIKAWNNATPHHPASAEAGKGVD